jgi:hypothetical protein
MNLTLCWKRIFIYFSTKLSQRKIDLKMNTSHSSPPTPPPLPMRSTSTTRDHVHIYESSWQHFLCKPVLFEYTYNDAKTEINKMQDWIYTICSKAANSLREVGDELLTVHKLGIKEKLQKSLSSTTLIESLFRVVRHKCSRVKNWKKSPTARMRWVASSAVAHQSKMRKIRGKDDFEKLVSALNPIEKELKSM